MPVDLPKDLLSRSKSHGDRADKYGKRIDKEMSQSQSARRSGTDLSWQETRTQLDDLLSDPRNMLIAFGVVALGVGLMIMSFAGGGGGRVFALGFFITLVAGFPCTYIISNMRRTRAIDTALFNHALSIDQQQEFARNMIRMSFSSSEVELAAIQAGVEQREMEVALIAAAASAYAEQARTETSSVFAQDIRDKDHELSVLDKNILLEEAKGRIRVSELEAQSKVNLSEIDKRNDLDLRNLNATLGAERERFDREMKLLATKNTQEAAMKRLDEITQLRKTLIAAHAELRANPALQDQVQTIIDEVNILQSVMEKLQPMTIEDYQRKEYIEQMMTRMLQKRHDLNDQQTA